MTEIHIIRHGETEWNLQHRAQGSKNSQLTDKGRQQAIDARHKIAGISFDAVYSSPTDRALDTAALLLNDPSQHVQRLDGLSEIDMGVWEGMTYDDIKAQHATQFDLFWGKPSQYQPIGGETFSGFRDRVMAACSDLVQKHQDETILLVSHAGFIKTLLTALQDKPLDDTWNEPFAGNLCHSVIVANDLGFQILKECE